LIILPQALRAVIPALVGQFISLFKDTSLVSLVGLVELLGVAQVVIKQPEWVEIQGGISREVYLFVAVVYFIFSFGMSYASKRLEVQLGVGKR
jgi:general L-amino acid transport system permease protein